MKKLCAILLAVLILLPFTTPFSTYDLASVSLPSTPAAAASATTSIPPPAIRTSGRVRIDALSAHHTIACASITVLRAHKRPVDASGRIVDAASLTTVLRL